MLTVAHDCGFAKDVLQKISDAPLTDCLSCGKPSFKKQVTAAGFQLKGTGWYVTDFRGGMAAPGFAPQPPPRMGCVCRAGRNAGCGASRRRDRQHFMTSMPASARRHALILSA